MNVFVSLRDKHVVTLSREAMQWLADGWRYMPKDIRLVCLRCKTNLQGDNAETDGTIRLTCLCTERRYRQSQPGEIKEN